MKILPPADENERQALKLRMERALGQEQGGYWRVDIIAGRYGWYVRPVRLRTRTKGESAREDAGSGIHRSASGGGSAVSITAGSLLPLSTGLLHDSGA